MSLWQSRQRELSTRYPEISGDIANCIRAGTARPPSRRRPRRRRRWHNYPRTPPRISPYSLEMVRAVTSRTCACKVIARESLASLRSPTVRRRRRRRRRRRGRRRWRWRRRRHARLCRSRFLHRFATATRSNAGALILVLLRSRATEFHRLYAGRAGDCRATHNKAARGNYDVGTFTAKRARLLRG